MSEKIQCDICGDSKNGKLVRDQDGLWVCGDCEPRLVGSPIGEFEDANLSDEIKSLKGKSVGAICLTLNLPSVPPYQDIINHADEMHNNLMSAWSFVTQWADGTTVWREEEGGGLALVTGDKEIHIRYR